MPALDFKEIPPAHQGDDSDAFEMFARDFLQAQGYHILMGPDRGPDGGRDLIAEEIRTGIGGETRVRWLVSCKHKAHSGSSVILVDEPNILDRVRANGCEGFIGVYSSVPASSLTSKLEGLSRNGGLAYQIYDRERLESILLSSSEGLSLAGRYFPVSVDLWTRENPEPSALFAEEPKLECDYCGNDLLNPPEGIVVILSEYNWENQRPSREQVVDLYWCCKGHCDRALKRARMQDGWSDGWEDIADLCSPLVHLKWMLSTMNELKAGITYTDQAFEKLKELLITLYPYVARDLTTKERNTLEIRARLPSGLGGL